MSNILTLILGLLSLLGLYSMPGSTPEPTTGSVRVVARACPAGVTASNVSVSVCTIWPDGAAVQVTDAQGNAWGMNARRDTTLPGSPVIYGLNDLAFGTYLLGQPILAIGFTSYAITGAHPGPSGDFQIDLTPAKSHAELAVYFLK